MSSWLLRIDFVKNPELRYWLKTKSTQKQLTGGNQQAENALEVDLVQKVLKVEEDGSAHVVSISTPKVSGGEKHRAAVYQHMSPRSEVLLTSNAGQTNAFTFPDQEVQIGSGWTGQADNYVPGNPNPVVMEYSYRIVAQEEHRGHSCLKIVFSSKEVQFEAPAPDGSGSSQVTTQTEGTILFAPEQGCMVGMTLRTRTVPSRGGISIEIVNQSEQMLQ